ncbi:MAG: hypothetical protein H7231_11800, partial [Rhodoferax sp.]|nr:hypothetical protein [Actinomycetota bacterium]
MGLGVAAVVELGEAVGTALGEAVGVVALVLGEGVVSAYAGAALRIASAPRAPPT